MGIIPGTLKVTIPKKSSANVDDAGKISADMSVWATFQDDNPDALPFDVYNYEGVARPGDVYFVNGRIIPRFVCCGVHASRITTIPDHIVDRRDSCWWKVEARYKWRGTPEGSPEYDEMSLSVSAGTIIVPTVARYDYFGNPILNSAGQIFDPPAQFDLRIPTFTITRDEYFNPMFKKIEFEGSVNSAPLWGLPKHTVMVNSIRPAKGMVFSQDPSKQSQPAWGVTYEIAINTATHGKDKDGEEIYGWQTAVLDCGKAERISDSGSGGGSSTSKLKKILDDSGLEIDEPVRLDGKGKKLESGNDVYIKFMLHPLADLNSLNLPNPLNV